MTFPRAPLDLMACSSIPGAFDGRGHRVLSKGLHRYRTFENDSKSCPECQMIWTYMQRTGEEQLNRVLAHLREHLGKESELKLRSA